jgi:hypothetical protein
MENMRAGLNNKNSRAVEGYNEDTDDYVVFYSVSEASRQLDYSRKAISNALIQGHKSKGYYWQYLNN